MVTVKKFNNISDIIYEGLPKENYQFIGENDEGDYDIALARSAELKDVAFPKNLLAIARAGAGYNNIPVDKPCPSFDFEYLLTIP